MDIENQPESGIPPERPYVLVVGVQFDQTGDVAWQEVMRLARRSNTRLDVHLCHVLNAPDEAAVTSAREQAIDALQLFALDKLEGAIRGHLHLHIETGDVTEELIQLAVDVNADAIVLGTHRASEDSRVVMGTVAEKLFDLSPCSVLVMRPKYYAGMVARRGFVEKDPFPPPRDTYRRISVPPRYGGRTKAMAV